MFTSLLIAAAIAFCAERPAEPRCTDAPVIVAEITDAHLVTLTELAADSRLGTRYRGEGLSDAWGQGNDCEDALLRAALALRQRHPELTDSYRFVAVQEGWDIAGTRRVRRMHLILVIEGADGRVVLDTKFGRLRAWSDYDHLPTFAAAGGLGGQWTPYS